MSNPEKRKAAEARINAGRVAHLIRRRIERLEHARAMAERRLEDAPEFSEDRASIGEKIRAIDEKMHNFRSALAERMVVVSEKERVLETFQVGRFRKQLATQVDEEARIGDLQRTTRLLMSLKRSGLLDTEVVSEAVDGRRTRRRWWWRVK